MSLKSHLIMYNWPMQWLQSTWQCLTYNVSQQCGIWTCVDSDKPLQPPFKLRNSKWCSVSSLLIIEYSSNKQRLWSDCAYAQADLRLCWLHIPHCWKSHALTQITYVQSATLIRGLPYNFSYLCWLFFQNHLFREILSGILSVSNCLETEQNQTFYKLPLILTALLHVCW